MMIKIDLRKKYIICDANTGEIIYDIFEYSKIRRGFGENDLVIERDGKVDEVYVLREVNEYSKAIYVDYRYHK